MKYNYTSKKSGVGVEFDATNQKEAFKELAKFQEIFDNDNKCGACKKNNLRYIVRTVDENDFHELLCQDCGCKLAFGVHKKGGSLFPKRKDDEGKNLENYGWVKWDGKKTENRK